MELSSIGYLSSNPITLVFLFGFPFFVCLHILFNPDCNLHSILPATIGDIQNFHHNVSIVCKLYCPYAKILSSSSPCMQRDTQRFDRRRKKSWKTKTEASSGEETTAICIIELVTLR
jgi:hypothetical protein